MSRGFWSLYACSYSATPPDRKGVGSEVTGVQTCALPIYFATTRASARFRSLKAASSVGNEPRVLVTLRMLIFSDSTRSEGRRVGSDWSSDVCSSDLLRHHPRQRQIQEFKGCFFGGK